MTMWTRFFDMGTGGRDKLDHELTFVELPLDEATEFFENHFGVDPYKITCMCCGGDFSIYEVEEKEVYEDSDAVIFDSNYFKQQSNGRK